MLIVQEIIDLMDVVEQFWSVLVSWFVLVPVALLMCVGFWFLLPAHQRTLMPRQRHRLVPWTGIEVFVVVFLSLFLTMGGEYLWQHLAGKPEGYEKQLRHFVTVLLTMPIFFFVSLVVLQQCGTSMYQLGLHTHRWRQNLVLAAILWLLAGLFLYLVNVLTVWLVESLGPRPDPHSLTEIVKIESAWLGWLILLLSALVAAPLLEEFLFRGVIQNWAVQSVWRGHAVLVIAIAVMVTEATPFVAQKAIFAGVLVAGHILCPMCFWRSFAKADPDIEPKVEQPLANKEWTGEPWWEDPFYQPIRQVLIGIRNWCDRFVPWLDVGGQNPAANRCRSIYATAVLFAGLHPWPTPIPLFLLGLLLGWLAYRTQSLIGPIALHVLFNAVACIQLALGSTT